ncbi:hypothetical protein EXA14_19200 [Vibrio cincinnatiensis]|nr:hypothetical protein [Vibrio cincinnatiensis]
MAFLLCVGLCDYSVMRKVGSSVVCPGKSHEDR